MCLKCVVKEVNDETNRFNESLAFAIMDAVLLLKALQDRGIALDPAEKQAYDKLLAFAKAEGRPASAPSREEMTDAIKKAFPDATVVVGTPEELQAFMEKEGKEANGGKSH